MYLERRGKLYGNIHIVSNSYEWDAEGNAIGVVEPIIHAMNKDETAIKSAKALVLTFSGFMYNENINLKGGVSNDRKGKVAYRRRRSLRERGSP